MLISLLTGGTTVINSAAFILLAPGRELSAYISASIIYGTGAWLILWILPAAWKFNKKKFAELRTAQALCTFVAASSIISIHPNTIGFSFACLLFLEFVFFFPYLLLFESRTRDYQMLELMRAMLNSVNLVTTVFLFAGMPSAYCTTLLGLTVTIGSVAAIRHHKPPPLNFDIRHFRNLKISIRDILSSKQLRYMLSARALEISAMQSFNWAGNLGMQLCLKVGISISQSLSSNAHSRSVQSITSVATILYFFTLFGALICNQLFSKWLPTTFDYININSILVVVPLYIFHLLLMIHGLRKDES